MFLFFSLLALMTKPAIPLTPFSHYSVLHSSFPHSLVTFLALPTLLSSVTYYLFIYYFYIIYLFSFSGFIFYSLTTPFPSHSCFSLSPYPFSCLSLQICIFCILFLYYVFLLISLSQLYSYPETVLLSQPYSISLLFLHFATTIHSHRLC